MTIKEAEKRTGLTAKSIRYYEAKGLITVERNEENSYRSYSENDVTRLKQIKLLRYLDFSIEEIRELLDKEETEIKDTLRDKAEAFADQNQICQEKQDICLALAEDYAKNPQVIEEYDDIIKFMESDEMAEIKKDLKDMECPNLPETIVWSLIFLGSILWLFLNIYSNRSDMLMMNAVLAIAGTALLTGSWMHYVQQYHRCKKRVKRINCEKAKTTLLLLVCCIIGISAVFAILRSADKLLVPPSDYLFSESHLKNYGLVVRMLLIIPIFVIFSTVVTKFGRKSMKKIEEQSDVVYIWKRLGKWRFLVLGLWGILLYCVVTNVTYVTEDAIVYYSPMHPMGMEYKYEDIEGVKAGFGNKIFTFSEYKRKGSFFYQIKVDGRNITFYKPYINEKIERYSYDTYLELEEFDQALMKLGIPKEADATGYENCDMDQKYVERFLRIVELEK